MLEKEPRQRLLYRNILYALCYDASARTINRNSRRLREQWRAEDSKHQRGEATYSSAPPAAAGAVARDGGPRRPTTRE